MNLGIHTVRYKLVVSLGHGANPRMSVNGLGEKMELFDKMFRYNIL